MSSDLLSAMSASRIDDSANGGGGNDDGDVDGDNDGSVDDDGLVDDGESSVSLSFS